MFSPNPVMDDGTIVVDAITVDGRHVDPFSIHVEPYTLREPNFDLLHAKSLRTNQILGRLLQPRPRRPARSVTR